MTIRLKSSELNEQIISKYRDLWAAVLEQAIQDVFDRDVTEKRDAKRWIKSDDPDFPSFVSVCILLDLDPGKVRRRVLTADKKEFRRRLKATFNTSHEFRNNEVKQLTKVGG